MCAVVTLEWRAAGPLQARGQERQLKFVQQHLSGTLELAFGPRAEEEVLFTVP
jgi:hypothetical protein